MSRSSPTVHTPHPCTRWFEWSGQDGEIFYYDKEAKEDRVIKLPFTFILLDELSSVGGFHKPSNSGIMSNEVRDTKKETLVVKAFKGGILAEGFYSAIRDRIAAVGGHYVKTLYLGFKTEKGLVLGALQLKGSALNEWGEFAKANREAIYKKAVRVSGFDQKKNGNINYRVPKLSIAEISEQTNTEANALDTVLQQFLKGYFQRTRVEQVSKPHAECAPQDDSEPSSEPEPELPPEPDPSDDVPF